MERDRKRRSSPGREFGEESSSPRPYADEQETHRNPRTERGKPRRQQANRERGDPADGGMESGPDSQEKRRNEQFDDPERQESRDTWMQPHEGNFSDARTRWPRDDKYRSEPRSQNWPHSRSGAGIGEYGYFHDESRQARGHSDRRQQSWATQGAQRSEGDYRGIGPKNYARSDERIREDICDRLSEDSQCDASDIEIEVTSGIVLLSGTVAVRHMKHRAEDIADNTRGVQDVDNRIRVKRAGSASETSPQEPSENVERDSENGSSARSSKNARKSR